MKRVKLAVAASAALIIACGRGVLWAQVEWMEIGRGAMDVRSVLVDARNTKVIFICAKSGVSKTQDGGKTWRAVLNISGQDSAVNTLFWDPLSSEAIYAASTSGLYCSKNQGDTWSRIFRGKSALENNCTSLAILPSTILLGTSSGLFVSRDGAMVWVREPGELGRSQILAVASDSTYTYVACVHGIFRSQDQGRSWKKIFSAQTTENEFDEGGTEGDFDEETQSSWIRYICCTSVSCGQLYAGTARGVYESHDAGNTWSHVSEYGLLNHDITFLLAAKSLYAVSKSGIFLFTDQRWEELSLRLAANEFKSVTVDTQGNLYAACDKGLFRADSNVSKEENEGTGFEFYPKGVPQIGQVQQAAIRYAEVEPEKIILWRRLAATRALLPKVTAGVNRESSDLWHWESGSTIKACDDILVKGRATLDWDISLSWDLGELIWSDAQTSIDTRSRLMVQLRNDILDEVTKLYFEQLRTKMELDSLAIEDRKKRRDKELRIGELTASLDALTGGYYSQQLNSCRRE